MESSFSNLTSSLTRGNHLHQCLSFPCAILYFNHIFISNNNSIIELFVFLKTIKLYHIILTLLQLSFFFPSSLYFGGLFTSQFIPLKLPQGYLFYVCHVPQFILNCFFMPALPICWILKRLYKKVKLQAKLIK